MNDIKQNIVKCQWCGLEGEADEFELDIANNNGFWCPDCDGHTFFEEENNLKRKFTLILENKSNEHNIYCKAPIKLNKRLSPLRYPGGKSKLIEYLYLKLQKDKCHTFIEPFAGGSSVGLALLDSKCIKKLILNDLDFGVYSLFYTILNNPNDIIHLIKFKTPTHTDFVNAQKIVLGKYENCTMLSAAWSFLIVNRLAFSGICKAGCLGGKNGSDDKLLSRWNSSVLINKIEKNNSMENDITILNDDACELVNYSHLGKP